MVKDLLLFTSLVSGQLGLYSQTKAIMPTVLSHLAGFDPFSPTDCPSCMQFLIKGKFCSIAAVLRVLSYALPVTSLNTQIYEGDTEACLGSCSESTCYPPARDPFQYVTGEREKRAGDVPTPVVIHPTGSGFNCDPQLTTSFQKNNFKFCL